MISNPIAQQPITLEVNGIPFTGFVDPISASCSVENLCGTFSFTTTQPKGNGFLGDNTFPIKKGDKCRVLINNISIVNGFVEEITVQYDAHNHTVSLEGRDKTCDIVDSTLDGKITFHAPLDLVSITKQVLDYLGINDIEVAANLEIKPFSQGEIISSEVGQTAFEFIEYYAKKRHVLMTTDGNGNILFTQSGTQQLQTVLANSERILSKPIIKSASVNLSDTRKFYKYVAYAQTNSAGMQIVNDFNQLPVDQEVSMISKPAYDTDIKRTSRVYNFMSDTSHLDQQDLDTRAVWEANVRTANGFKYGVTVQGFIAPQDNLIWRPNQLVTVVDDLCNVNSVLLVSSVKYSYSMDSGSETSLELVNKDAFTTKILDKETKTKTEKTHKEGIIYKF